MNREPVLTKKDLRKAAWRWIPMAVNTYTYQYQQAGSVVFALGPSLRKIYPNDEEYSFTPLAMPNTNIELPVISS